MSNKSGTSEQVISVPKGGGALSGIGETFSPDLHTGTGNFTVPIAVPPGRNGFQPELNLIYSTGNGNGPFGLGWNLSIPGVGRKTAKVVPRYDDEDIFILSGAEDLVPVETEPGRTRYRPRTEGLFALINRFHDPDNDYWQVKSKDGLVSLYGTPEMSGTDPAVIANPDPARRENVFAWKLTETQDPFGNRIVYDYLRDSGEDGPHHWDQLYLERIRYVDYGDDTTTEARFLVSVTFEYSEPDERPDPFSEYRPGFEIRTRRRCRRIVVRTHADTERLVRTYNLQYVDEPVDAGELPASARPLNGVSILSRIVVTGHDGDETESLPPLQFGYTHFEPEGRDFFPLTGRAVPVHSLASPDTELADLFGNGLPDIIQMNSTVRYWRNLGQGQFDLARPMDEAPAGLALGDPGIQLIDADGDGRIDLLAHQNGLSGYFPLRHDGEWDRRSFRRSRVAPSFDLADPEVKLVDLNGDGVTDAIRAGSRLECFFNDPQEGWAETRRVERRDIDSFPDINFSDPRVKWGDMNGDGLQDIVLVHDGNIEYWPNLGHGNWGSRIHMSNSPRFPYGYHPDRILIGDVDGDGLADLVFVDHAQVLLYLNRSGNGWSEQPIIIDGTPPVTDMDAVRLVDMLGSGIAGVLWSRDANGTSRDNYFFLDFTGGLKPYLLNELNNQMGAVTRVAYAPSTDYYLADQRRRETRWQTSLPFPVQVVARVEVIDELSRGKLTTEYRYHHGYWDGAEREFRGFGMVEQLDTELFEDYNAPGLHDATEFETVETHHFSHPTLTKTWFHQGPIGEEFGAWQEADYSHEYWSGDPQMLDRPADLTAFLRDGSIPRRVKRDALRTMRGHILRTELYALDSTEHQDRPYTVTEASYTLREESPPEPADRERQHIFFPYPVAQRTTQWERGDDPMTQFSFTSDYDDFGQPQTQTRIACPRGWRRLTDTASEPFLATQSRTVYARPVNPAEVYIYDRVARTTAYEIVNDGHRTVTDLRDLPGTDPAFQLIGQAINYYDDEPFTGGPFGEVGPYGAVVRTETLVLTEEILRAAYRGDDPAVDLPPYLVSPGTTPSWPAEYPAAFREQLPPLAGYIFYPGDDEHTRGYFSATTRRSYDFHDGPVRGLPLVTRGPLGNDTQIGYDTYALLPVRVTDLTIDMFTEAHYDYRVLQPAQVTDPNANRQAFEFTPLGLPARIFVRGKEGETVGDLEAASTRFEYGLRAFVDSPPDNRQPVWVRTIRREYHDSDSDVPLPERDAAIETREYSDGFGRLLQTRTQGEEVRFGDPSFGNGTVPADQADRAGTSVAVAGHRNDDPDQPNVVVSGWQIYDNKGKVVEKYEPFFDAGWDYAPPEDAHLGQKATMFYDPRGQVIRTRNPDGSEQRVIYGVPPDLTDPDHFTPTPWEAYTYDANDLAPLSRFTAPDGSTTSLAGRAPEAHHFTPANVLVDALGRTVLAVERNRERRRDDDSWSDIQEYTTRSTYDIRGNLLTVTDALEREAFRYTYDLTLIEDPDSGESSSQVLRIENIDAGLRRIVLDAAGNEIERRDSKGALILQAYDELHRLRKFWARDDAAAEVTMRQQLIYGDGSAADQSPAERTANRERNRLGQLVAHYDEAGRVTFDAFDFKGNLLEKTRRVIDPQVILSVFEAVPPDGSVEAYRVDWQPPPGQALTAYAETLLDETVYQTSTTYDALNRVKLLTYPEDVEVAAGERASRAVLRPIYNRAGALEQVRLDDDLYVERIAYNAKGQRTLIAYGNGVMTRYAYDPHTFRLARLRSERYTRPDATTPTYMPSGPPLQDFGYDYDLAGNISAIHDRTPDSGIRTRPDQLDRVFTYDPIYRLVTATGRETDHPVAEMPWLDGPRHQDVTRTRDYTQQYDYDRMGNMTRLQHTAGAGSFTRQFEPVPGIGPVPESNQLQAMTVNGVTYQYQYDANGNMTAETTSRHFDWDHSDRLKAFRSQAEAARLSQHAHYLYDAGGQRVMKLVRSQGGQVEVRIYIDGIFEHDLWRENGQRRENNHLHIMDGQQRIALVRRGPAHSGDAGPTVQYHLGDHLGSNNLVISGDGSWINHEEYFPYGETSFGSFSQKRYRFTGKERDEESGLNYHGARYYAPWLARWPSIDPLVFSEPNLTYAYVRNNPLRFNDPTGFDANEETLHAIRTVQEVVNRHGPGYDPTRPSQQGTEQHGRVEQTLRSMGNRRIITEAVIDPEGNVVSHGDNPVRTRRGRLARGPGAIPTLRRDARIIARIRDAGQSSQWLRTLHGRTVVRSGYFRTIDVLVVTDDAVDAVRAGRVSARGHVLPFDVKFGNNVLSGSTDIFNRLGAYQVAVRPGGSALNALRRAASRFTQWFLDNAGVIQRVLNAVGMITLAVEIAGIPARAQAISRAYLMGVYKWVNREQGIIDDAFEFEQGGAFFDEPACRGLLRRQDAPSDPDPFGPPL